MFSKKSKKKSKNYENRKSQKVNGKSKYIEKSRKNVIQKSSFFFNFFFDFFSTLTSKFQIFRFSTFFTFDQFFFWLFHLEAIDQSPLTFGKLFKITWNFFYVAVQDLLFRLSTGFTGVWAIFKGQRKSVRLVSLNRHLL